jgi:hypothetical protein
MQHRRFAGGKPNPPTFLGGIAGVRPLRLASELPTRVAETIEAVGEKPGFARTLEHGLDARPSD